MKDRVSLFATLLLIILVVALIVITLENRSEGSKRDQQIRNLTTTVYKQGKQLSEFKSIRGIDGKTPIKGVDYFDGAKGETGSVGPQGEKGDTGATGKPGQKGETGGKGDSGERGANLDIKCLSGVIAKKYSTDSLWKYTNIKCEVTDE